MRKTVEVTINEEGRDHGKVFLITEMSSRQTERWADRALLALSRSGQQIPVGGAGLAGVAVMGLRALMAVEFAEVEPLLEEMMACIQIYPDPKNRDIIRKLNDIDEGGDIEEVKTRFTLRAEVFKLHTGFSFADIRSRLTSESPSATS